MIAKPVPHFKTHGPVIRSGSAPRSASSFAAGLIKCGYNQGLIGYWFPPWDSRVLNNALLRGSAAAARAIHPSPHQSSPPPPLLLPLVLLLPPLLLSRDWVFWCSRVDAYLLRQTAAIQLSPPKWPALPSLTCFSFFFFINKVVR